MTESERERVYLYVYVEGGEGGGRYIYIYLVFYADPATIRLYYGKAAGYSMYRSKKSFFGCSYDSASN